jgi:DNA polymerase-3 subunit delta'
MTGRRRVFVVMEAENLNEPSANSLLKVLEEPPSFTTIILVTAFPYRLPATIRSRCQTLTFSPIGREEIEEILREREVGPEQARLTALLVEGNLERALELDWEEVQALKAEAWDLFDALASEDRSSRFLERFGTVPKAAQEEFSRVLEIFSSFVRDILLLRLGGDPSLLLNPDFADRLREAAAAWSPARALGALAALDRLAADLQGNLNKSLLATAFFSNFGELRHA